jgi:hypothetical protein
MSVFDSIIKYRYNHGITLLVSNAMGENEKIRCLSPDLNRGKSGPETGISDAGYPFGNIGRGLILRSMKHRSVSSGIHEWFQPQKQ